MNADSAAAAASDSTSEVLIVGAGPVGLTAALLLAHRGVRVEVWERWAEPYPLPRAVALAHEPLRVLKSIGVEIDVRGDLEPWGANGQRFYLEDADGRILLESSHPADSVSGGATMFTFTQPDLERELEQLAVAHPLIDLRRGISLVSFGDDGATVHVTGEAHDGLAAITNAPGREVSVRYLIGADGANSTVRETLGIELDDRGFQHEWFVVDVLPHDMAAFSRHGVQHLDPSRPTTLIGGGPGRRRWEFMVTDADTDAGTDFTDPATAWRLLEPWGVTPENAAIERTAMYTFRARTALEWRRGRVFLAGDAAHQTPPFLGQGFNSGVRDAANLAWRLAAVLTTPSIERDAPPEAFLDAYTSERRTQFDDILTETVAVGRMICVTDPEAAKQRDERLAKRSGEIRPARTEWRIGAGTHRSGDPGAGTLSHHGTVANGERTGRFDDIVGAGPVLIVRDATALGSLRPPTDARWGELGGIGVHFGDGGLVDVDGTYRRWLDELGVCAVLVRPDFYVYGSAVGPQDVTPLVEDYLDELHPKPSGGN